MGLIHTMDKTNFFQDVYEVARLVPEGKVTSYGAIGNYLGAKSSARMVGWAMNVCPEDVPAHRVVNRIGLLTGKHKFPSNSMEELLLNEGVKVVDNQVVDFDKHFWDPMIELNL